MENHQFIGYVGTYTKEKSEGIYTFTLDPTVGKITKVSLAAKVDNPTYVAISSDNEFLYSVSKEGEAGGIAALKTSPSGELTWINQQVAEGSPPCHVSVNQDHTLVFSANYHKGTVEMYEVNDQNGALLPASSLIQHTGSGPDERQEKPHTHYAGLTPDEKFLVAVDLGIDKVITYERNDGILTEKHQLSIKAGSGPRHITFHPNGKFAYVMTEFSSEVIVLSYDSAHGRFAEIQSISTLPDDFHGNNQGSAIHISSDGRFVYAGNRGHDSIAVFSVNGESGKLSFVEHTSTKGNWPRDFVLDPTEAFMVASNQNSHNLVLFSRNEESGKLTLLQSDITVPEPVCVKFLNKPLR